MLLFIASSIILVNIVKHVINNKHSYFDVWLYLCMCLLVCVCYADFSVKAGKLISLVPTNLENLDVATFGETVNQYLKDLPAPEVLDEELDRWKRKFTAMSDAELPCTYASAIKCCDRDIFPNIHTLLKLGCTMPVTSCECERNISSLRRLSNYMRASMGQQRLSALALMHIHYNISVDVDLVIDTFAKKQPRRLEILH